METKLVLNETVGEMGGLMIVSVQVPQQGVTDFLILEQLLDNDGETQFTFKPAAGCFGDYEFDITKFKNWVCQAEFKNDNEMNAIWIKAFNDCLTVLEN